MCYGFVKECLQKLYSEVESEKNLIENKEKFIEKTKKANELVDVSWCAI